MFELWKLQRRLKKAEKVYEKELAKHREKKGNADDLQQLEHSYEEALVEAYRDVQVFKSDQLIRIAIKIDARLPDHEDKTFWVLPDHFYGIRRYLNTTGRDLMKTRIKEIKDRDFESKTLWVTKFWLPLLAALVGIIGAATGFIAVWRHGK
jgi:hypothetical protein